MLKADQRDDSSGELLTGEKSKAPAVDIGVAATVPYDLVPTVREAGQVAWVTSDPSGSMRRRSPSRADVMRGARRSGSMLNANEGMRRMTLLMPVEIDSNDLLSASDIGFSDEPHNPRARR